MSDARQFLFAAASSGLCLWIALDSRRFLRIFSLGTVPFRRGEIFFFKGIGTLISCGTAVMAFDMVEYHQWGIGLATGIAILAFASLFISNTQAIEVAPPTNISLPQAWAKLRRLRKTVIFLFVGWIPVIFPVIVAANFLEKYVSGVLGIVLGFVIPIGWMIALGMFYSRWGFFACPRCGKAFFYQSRFLLARRCAYCKLPLWSETVSAIRQK